MKCALLLLLLGFPLTTLAVPLADRVRLTREHVDIRVIEATSGTNRLQVILRDHDRGTNYASTNALLVVSASARLEVPDGFPSLGPSGSSLWVLPASQDPELPYVGVSGEGLNLPPQAFDLFVRRIDGSAAFKAWQFDGAGEIRMSVNSGDGLGSDDRFRPSVGAHEHHNLAFSSPGYSLVWLQARATVDGADLWSPETPVLFAVEPLLEDAASASLATLEPASGSTAALVIQGSPGAVYRLETSDTFATWEALEEFIAGPSPITIPISVVADQAARFYRVVGL